jgi:hypothetical protein
MESCYVDFVTKYDDSSLSIGDQHILTEYSIVTQIFSSFLRKISSHLTVQV